MVGRARGFPSSPKFQNNPIDSKYAPIRSTRASRNIKFLDRDHIIGFSSPSKTHHGCTVEVTRTASSRYKQRGEVLRWDQGDIKWCIRFSDKKRGMYNVRWLKVVEVARLTMTTTNIPPPSATDYPLSCYRGGWYVRCSHNKTDAELQEALQIANKKRDAFLAGRLPGRH